MKPKRSQKGDKNKSNTMDRCQTPFYAIDPILPYLPASARIWEPAAGQGNIVRKLEQHGFTVTGTDILTGHNFFTYEPASWDIQVTNPPYSIKYEWLERSYQLNKPFALLIPVESIGTSSGQYLFDKYGIEVIWISPRVNFYMPQKGYSGGGSQFPTAWFTWGLGIGQQMTFAKITQYADEQLGLQLDTRAALHDPAQLTLTEASR